MLEPACVPLALLTHLTQQDTRALVRARMIPLARYPELTAHRAATWTPTSRTDDHRCATRRTPSSAMASRARRAATCAICACPRSPRANELSRDGTRTRTRRKPCPGMRGAHARKSQRKFTAAPWIFPVRPFTNRAPSAPLPPASTLGTRATALRSQVLAAAVAYPATYDPARTSGVSARIPWVQRGRPPPHVPAISASLRTVPIERDGNEGALGLSARACEAAGCRRASRSPPRRHQLRAKNGWVASGLRTSVCLRVRSPRASLQRAVPNAEEFTSAPMELRDEWFPGGGACA